jgi:PPOX class probable F420-dependent enzyme
LQFYTTLPSRGSFVQLEQRQLSHLLEVWPVARLASVGPQQQPHLVPIVFVVLDGAIYSPVDGKPKRNGVLQRMRNVAAHASVSLLLDQYDDDWDRLWWVRIDADAEVVTEPDAQMLQRVAAALRRKYPQYASVEPFAGVPTVLRLQPTRHTAWSSQTVAWESL